MNKAYRAELLNLLSKPVKGKNITVKGSWANSLTVVNLIKSSVITGCTVDGTNYDFNSSGKIWDSTEYQFNNDRMESIARD